MRDHDGATLTKVEVSEILQEIQELISKFKTVQLATLNSQGNPEASYTPYIKLGENYYVFISELASHTKNILQHPVISLFFIQNESDSSNLFARQRIAIECTATETHSDTRETSSVLDHFQAEHGDTVGLLRSLSDFRLFALQPTNANYIRGFGQAFHLEGKSLQQVSRKMGK